jgi:hypothetical protein
MVNDDLKSEAKVQIFFIPTTQKSIFFSDYQIVTYTNQSLHFLSFFIGLNKLKRRETVH